MSMQAIKQWLMDHPEKAADLLNTNPSYIFFEARETNPDQGPLGTMGIPLTAQRSIAVDRKSIPLGSPVWLSTQLPDREVNENAVKEGKSVSVQAELFQHLVFAQDTGGAIKGHARADLFWGSGKLAEFYAGKMRQPGRLYLFQPRQLQVSAGSINAKH